MAARDFVTAWNRLDRELVRRALSVRSPRVSELPRRAAVALVLTEAPLGVEVLLIRRATRAGDPWSGQMALPGGHHAEADGALLETALREAAEEVGVDLRQSGELLGQLDDVLPGNAAVAVSPFVFAVESRPVLTPRSEEVDAVVWASLGALARGESRIEHELRMERQVLRFPAFQLGEHVVWGMTYRVLLALIERVRETLRLDSLEAGDSRG